jgi:Suppressor of fused protein (SUFU)
MIESSEYRAWREDTEYRAWWEAKWKERETLLKGVFGETFPAGVVTGFFWRDLDLLVPGACAMVFAPRPPIRHEWLTLTHGLTQPLSPEESRSRNEPSAYGAEFGFLTKEHVSWPVEALGQLMTYLKQSGEAIERGHRVPMWFSSKGDREISPVLGKASSDVSTRPVGQMRALLFWPYMSHRRAFETSTGYFSVLVATAITQPEWDMAKATSSAHVLLLLFKANIGQISDLPRGTVTENESWAAEWQNICQLSPAEAEERLLDYAGG